MKLSIFESDGTLGRSPSDPPQLPPIDGDCSCVWGTPYRDASGNCRCDSDLPQLGNYGGPRVLTEHAVQYILPWQPINAPSAVGARGTAAGGTIFGLSPLMLVVIAGGGLWLLSSMGGTTKKTRGGEYV